MNNKTVNKRRIKRNRERRVKRNYNDNSNTIQNI